MALEVGGPDERSQKKEEGFASDPRLGRTRPRENGAELADQGGAPGRNPEPPDGKERAQRNAYQQEKNAGSKKAGRTAGRCREQQESRKKNEGALRPKLRGAAKAGRKEGQPEDGKLGRRESGR